MIISRLQGGMGNQMFQYAVGRNLALKNKVPLALDVTFLNHRIKMPQKLRPHFTFRSFDLDVFNIESSIAKPSDISFWNGPILSGQVMLVIDAVLRKLAFLPGWEKKFSFDEKVLSLGPNTYLEGFWQSPKYFEEIKDVIRKDFSLKEKLPENVQKLFDEIQSKESVCLHVRRADMALVSQVSFHGSCDLEYYKRGMEYISKNKKIDQIYVFSDDIAWCKENIKLDYPIVYVEKDLSGKKGEGHLMLMSACKNFVIPNSTFSWWAAWLGDYANKIVVAPKGWFTDDSIDTKDLFEKGWIQL